MRFRFVAICFMMLWLLGCDKLPKCRPQINIKTEYVGIVCGGDW